MRVAMKAVWANPYVRVLVAIAALVVLVLVFRAIAPAGWLFLGAMGLAYLVNPVVDWLELRRVWRGLGVGMVAVALIGSLIAATVFVLNAIDGALAENDDGVGLSHSIIDFFDGLPKAAGQVLPRAFSDLVVGPLNALATSIRRLDEVLEPHQEAIALGAFELIGGTVTGVVHLVLLLVLTVYALYDYHRLSASLVSLFPEPYQPTVRSLAATLDRVTGTFIRGQVLIAACVGLMVFAGLSALGLPLAGVIGLLAAFLNIVPFIGSVVPAIPAVVIALGGGWVQVILVIIVFVIANQIDAHVLTPLILSKSTQLHPITVMLAVIGGFAYGGVLTAVLAVPVVGFFKALYVEYYTRSAFYRRG
jgi:predicted PurR-regulated permease PerM